MYFAESPERAMLKEAARAYLERKSTSSRVRELMETDGGFDAAMWKEVCAMGWASVAVPEELGGSGFGPLESAVVMEELGRMLTPLPYLSSVVLAAQLLLASGSAAQREEFVPAVASGDLLMTVALAEPEAGWDLERVATEASPGGRITGTKSFVLDGGIADLVVVPAVEDGALALFVVDPADDAVAVEPLGTMDLTRKQAAMHFDGAPAVTRLDPGEGALEALRRLVDLAVTMLAFEQVGGAERCMEMSVSYAKERIQFGRPIGSFQAVKHKCAQMLVDVEAARSTALYAARMIADASPDAGVAAALAKVRCSDAFFDVAAETIQVHGGIGFTWEHDAHLYFKRAKTDRLLFGEPAAWRATLGHRLGL